jgi:hypothetical protein
MGVQNYYFISTVPGVHGSEPTMHLKLHIHITKSSSSGRGGPRSRMFFWVSVSLASYGPLLLHQGFHQQQVGPQWGRQETGRRWQGCLINRGPPGGRWAGRRLEGGGRAA